MVGAAQTVEIDLNLEKAAKPPVDVKGKGKMPVGSSSGRRGSLGAWFLRVPEPLLVGRGNPRN
jgi:hypothetical protein